MWFHHGTHSDIWNNLISNHTLYQLISTTNEKPYIERIYGCIYAIRLVLVSDSPASKTYHNENEN